MRQNCIKMMLYYIFQFAIILILALNPQVFGQVCTSIGSVCTRTTDCCKGCCEAYVCVDRSFPCSTDMIAQPGYQMCSSYSCPPDHICFLREICPPENPCPRAPSCRKVDYSYGNRSVDYRYRNASAKKNLTPFFQIMVNALFVAVFGYLFKE